MSTPPAPRPTHGIIKMVFCVRRRTGVPVEEFHHYRRNDHDALVKEVSGNL